MYSYIFTYLNKIMSRTYATKLDFLCLSHRFLAITFLIFIWAKCVRDENCREKIAPTSLNGFIIHDANVGQNTPRQNIPCQFLTPRTKHPTSICHPGQNIPCSFCHPGQNIPRHFAWDVLSVVTNLCGMFCQWCQKMAWDVLSCSPMMPQLTLRIDALFEHFNQSANKLNQICQSKSYIAPP